MPQTVNRAGLTEVKENYKKRQIHENGYTDCPLLRVLFSNSQGLSGCKMECYVSLRGGTAPHSELPVSQPGYFCMNTIIGKSVIFNA